LIVSKDLPSLYSSGNYMIDTAGIIKPFVSGYESRILLFFWMVNYFII